MSTSTKMVYKHGEATPLGEYLGMHTEPGNGVMIPTVWIVYLTEDGLIRTAHYLSVRLKNA